MKLMLTEKRAEAGDAVSFIFKPDAEFSWQAGQYLHYTIPADGADDRGAERWFTIAAAPAEGYVQITTRISEKSSTFKRHLSGLSLGDTIDADGPEGDFVVHDPGKQMVCIAGGIGITPFRAMLVDADRRGIDLHVTLLYANRDTRFVFQDELDSLAQRHSWLTIRYFSGDNRIDEAAIRAAIPDLTAPLFYLSGPEPMVKSLAETLAHMGVREERLKLDDFPGYTWP